MKEPLRALLDDPRLWRAGRRKRHWPTLSSGHAELDARLPGGGWPATMLTEIAVERWGSGELALFMPLLAQLSADRHGRAADWITWISPPFLPYAPALAAAGLDLSRLLLVRAGNDVETLWATEQALQSGACQIVLAWAGYAEWSRLRRLQLASESGQTPLILFRPLAALAGPSPASLRLRLAAADRSICLQLVKHRGGAMESLPVTCLHGR